jgi:general stress protein 26
MKMEKHADEIHDLSHREAIEKIQLLTKHNKICMFTTHLTEVPFQTRPMSVQEVDDDGNLWFLSGADSRKNWDISEDARVQLVFANQSDYEFLSIFGHAEEFKDRDKIEQIWNPIAKAWFKEGKDDPNITAIRVTPEDAYYWDTKSNKAVALLKIVTSVFTGKTMDDGEEGTLRV